ncbi:MAG: ATP-binding cassette domain-containing protein [Planctomycetota bacterium]|jgi:ABC-type multidrug transport system fused ATPase/permease subunit
MWTRKKSRRALRTLGAFGKRHGAWLFAGCVGTLLVVLVRIAMPWPLRGILEVVALDPGSSGPVLNSLRPEGMDPILYFSLGYLILALTTGVSEMFQRVSMKKFSVRTVHDARSTAAMAVLRRSQEGTESKGDIISRLVGDAARLKAGLSGILVHLTQNALTVVGVCVVFLVLDLQLGLIFVAAGLAAVWIGHRTAPRVAKTAGKQRRKEAVYAETLRRAMERGDGDWDLAGIDDSSARKDVKTTRMITLSTVVTHGVLAVTIGAGLWIGARGVQAGTIVPGVLFLFVIYAITFHRRAVHVGRQMSRGGRVLACSNRIGRLLEESVTGETPGPAGPLRSGVRLEDVKLGSLRKKKGPARLRRTSLFLPAGGRVAVLGGEGDGKSSLLRLLAGREPAHRGTVHWDDQDLTGANGSLSSRVGYLAQDPAFPPSRLWQLLGLESPSGLTEEQKKILKDVGAWKVIKRFPKGLEEKMGSAQLSPNEARALNLAAVLLKEAQVWILDAPLEGTDGRTAKRRVREILRLASGRTLVLSMTRPVDLDLFDRVWTLRDGKIRFDGTPLEYERHEVQERRNG